MRRLLFAVAALAAMVGSVAAQDWSGNVTLYGWLPSMQGSQLGISGEPIVDASAKDLLEALDFAAFATGEIRHDRAGLYFDFAYVDLGANVDAKLPFISGATVDTQITFLTVAGTWRIQGDTEKFIDVYGGARYYTVDVNMDINAFGSHVQRSVSANADWLDPVLGIKGRYPFDDRWSVYGFGDIGGFGLSGMSNLTWQAYAGVNYAFTENITGNLGYRYMSIDYDDEIKLDMNISGPVLGLTYRF
jgi:opacity protein-like surface antigen